MHKDDQAPGGSAAGGLAARTLLRFGVLARLPRTGYLMRGVENPESVAEHCFAAALLACLLLPEMRRQGFAPDGEKLLSMLLLHEAGEVIVGDIPSPAAALLGPGAKSRAESAAAAAVLREHPERAALVEEFETGDSLEARVARSLDKLQLILKVLEYESQGRGGLAEFWDYGGNFPRCGVPAVDGLFGEARALRGKPGLDYLATLSAAALSGPG